MENIRQWTNIHLNSPRKGAVLPPLILWLLGVPGIVVILLWLFVFRG